MNAKHLTFAAVFTLLAAVSCKKDKIVGGDNPPAYIPSTIYLNDQPYDSIVYNSSGLIGKIFYQYYRLDGYTRHMEFDYNNAGQCIRVRRYRDGVPLRPVDSLIYGNGGFTLHQRDLDGPSVRYEDKFITVNGNGLTLIGSKDTIIRNDTRYLNFFELSYTNGNMTTTERREYERTPDGQIWSDDTFKLNYTVDNSPNGMYWIFSKNPYAAYLLNFEIVDLPILSTGRNNFTSFEYQQLPDAPLVYNMENTYDPVSGFLREQKITGDEGFVDATFKFNYVERK